MQGTTWRTWGVDGQLGSLKKALLLFFFFLAMPTHVEVLSPGIEPKQRPEPQQ